MSQLLSAAFKTAIRAGSGKPYKREEMRVRTHDLQRIDADRTGPRRVTYVIGRINAYTGPQIPNSRNTAFVFRGQHPWVLCVTPTATLAYDSAFHPLLSQTYICSEACPQFRQAAETTCGANLLKKPCSVYFANRMARRGKEL